MASKPCPRNPSELKAHQDFLGWHDRNEIREQVFERDLPLCVWCHCKLTHDHREENFFTVDHVVTRSAGGTYVAENLVLACKLCNNKRQNKTILQFLAEEV